MSYSTQAKMARDNALLDRVTACAAMEGMKEPTSWAFEHQWKLSAEPGWDSAYAYAIAMGNKDPGNDETVISDSQILTSVQKIVAEEAAIDAERETKANEQT